MRLMTRHGLVPLFKSAKRYSSYKGELTKAPKNLANRDFHAERPNMPWAMDLTEFSIPAGKAYLPPVIDCHDGMPVAAPARTRHWPTACSPTSAPRSRTERNQSSIPIKPGLLLSRGTVRGLGGWPCPMWFPGLTFRVI